jgi:dTMP kinase
MPIEEAIRRGGFGQERYEKASMQQRVRELFLKLREPDWCVVDARRSMDEIHIELFKHASALIAECSTTPLREDLWQS